MRRIALIIAVVLLLALAGSLSIHSLAARQALLTQLALRNADAAAALAAQWALSTAGPGELSAAAAAQWGSGRFERLLLSTPDRQVLLDLHQAQAQADVPAWFAQALPLAAEEGRAVVGPRSAPRAMLQVQTDTGWARAALWQACFRTALLLVALGALGAGLLAWAWRSWRRPLQAAVDQAQALADGRFVQAAEPDLAELLPLTRSMNATVLRLREVFAAQAEQVALLQRQAQLDLVTGLPLRQHFLGRLQQRLADPGGPSVALLLVRVLHLESLNPRLGHEATDRLLGAIADVLMTYVERVPGTFAGRLNGSDFALCLPVSGVAQETADSLRAALAAVPALRSGGAEAVIGGVDDLRASGSGPALAAADAALARAEAGSGVAIERQDDRAGDGGGSRAWRDQIASALAEGRVRLAECEVVDRAGSLLHLECPLRVQLQRGGDYVAAERWLALARRSRLLPQVDVKAVELALAAIAEDGRPRAVHASVISVETAGFVTEVAERLRAAPGAAARLTIEVVEGARQAVLAPLAAAAAAWRQAGARLAVEHAGSAPQHLPEMGEAGIAYVKVNARHLRGVGSDAAVRGYAQSLVALIHGLGARAIAERLDRAEDLATVWSLGFDGAGGAAPAASQPMLPT